MIKPELLAHLKGVCTLSNMSIILEMRRVREEETKKLLQCGLRSGWIHDTVGARVEDKRMLMCTCMNTSTCASIHV